MFSVQQKRDISDAVQKILRATNHPELPATGEISFHLHIDGAADWSWADIRNNGTVGDPGVNPHNERMAEMSEEEGRDVIKTAQDLFGKEEPDPRATPDEHLREMMDRSLGNLSQRIQKAEEIIVDYNRRLNALEDFLKEIMEDDVIRHYGDQIANLNTAIRQLGNPQINKTLKGG